MRRLLIVPVLALAAHMAAAHVPSDMATAAVGFLDTLPEEQGAKAALSFESDERARWHFLPPEMFPRGGVALRDLGDKPRAAARQLLQTGLSQRGLLAADAIMELENVVRALDQTRRFARDALEYYVSVFGVPDAAGTWGWRFEGHHLSLNFTIIAGQVSVSTPTFLGTNPAELREGPHKGQRPLGAQEDLARALAQSLTASQRKLSIIADTAPADIVTGNQHAIDPLVPAGIATPALEPGQRQALKALIEAHAALLATEIAAVRLARMYDAGFENVSFAWAGPTEPGQPHYYRVQGPTLLIEYANIQNDANHAHSVWREFNGDFGADLLREHYRSDAVHSQEMNGP